MSFQLGDAVEYEGFSGVVIGIDTRSGGGSGYLIGFDSNGHGFYQITLISLLGTDKLIENYREYPYARWLCAMNLRPSNVKGYSKVHYRTLRKRMRDQIAQEIYKE